MKIEEICEAASVIPVLEVERLQDAAPLAEALAQGGLRVVELTLRTDCALDAIAVMKDAAGELVIGMGTVLRPGDVSRAVAAGAQFLVTPGASARLLKAIVNNGAPALPGAATAGEALTASEAGFSHLKFFPAVPAGGLAYLKALGGPMPHLRFCPTGGVGEREAPDYLALPNVPCVGGSWVATRAMIAEGRFDQIAANAGRAGALKL